MTIPFYGKDFTFTQPDGTKLPVRGWGDQRQAVFETHDGFTVVEDPVTGYYNYASRSADGENLHPTGGRPGFANPEALGLKPGIRIKREAAKAKALEAHGLPPGRSRWEQRRAAARLAMHAALAAPGIMPAPPKHQTVGTFIGLCLLVQFPDVQGTIAQQEVSDFCNKHGYNGFGNNGSVYDYYNEVSGGKLKYTNIVAPFYTAKHPRAYYTDESVDQPIRARELIKDALDDLKSRNFDFSHLTVDSQNYVYALNVFYAGPLVNNWAKGLWPHSYHLLTPYPLTVNKVAFDYQFTNMDDELTLGTFCHENGHMICDFPDLYDYGYESRGVGAYCLMCAGPLVEPKNPPQIGAYLKYKAGWANNITRIVAGLNGTVNAGVNDFYMHSRAGTEYYLIENRNQSGRDAALPSAGLAIWRVDELGDNSNEQMTSSMHYECALVQADGKFNLENGVNDGDPGDLYYAGGVTQFNDATKPNSRWWDGSASNLEITNISGAGPQMTFVANV